MAKETYKARVVHEDDGSIQITPYVHTERKRFPELKKLLHGELSESGSTYRLLISVSKVHGPQRAAEIMLDEATMATEYLYDQPKK